LASVLPFAEVDTVTYIAQIVNRMTENGQEWYELEILTSDTGEFLDVPSRVTVTPDQILSDRPFRDIQPRSFYYFGSRLLSGPMQYGIKATNFALIENDDAPLAKTSNAGLGSGIYGQYIKDEATLARYRADPRQDIYQIDIPAAYLVQDKEHGDSLTVASLRTNRYLDDLIRRIQSDKVSGADQIRALIQTTNLDPIVRLWNIVLWRSEGMITREWFQETLIEYIIRYQGSENLTDSLTGAPIRELPINLILRRLGYEGILGSDYHSNKWNRGCVSYNYEQAAMLQGNRAAYPY
jgi:hypothetical protein